MTTKKKLNPSSQVKSKAAATAAQRGAGVLRTNDIVAEQASACDDFVAAMAYNSIKELVGERSPAEQLTRGSLSQTSDGHIGPLLLCNLQGCLLLRASTGASSRAHDNQNEQGDSSK